MKPRCAWAALRMDQAMLVVSQPTQLPGGMQAGRDVCRRDAGKVKCWQQGAGLTWLGTGLEAAGCRQWGNPWGCTLNAETCGPLTLPLSPAELYRPGLDPTPRCLT